MFPVAVPFEEFEEKGVVQRSGNIVFINADAIDLVKITDVIAPVKWIVDLRKAKFLSVDTETGRIIEGFSLIFSVYVPSDANLGAQELPVAISYRGGEDKGYYLLNFNVVDTDK